MITRSGLKSVDCAITPPRLVRGPVPAGTIGVSPKLVFVGPTTCGSSSSTSMPSSDSQKSMPWVAGSNVLRVSTSPVEVLSITVLGGTRPPGPTRVGAGTGLPCESTLTVGDPISVTVSPVAPGRNSCTLPATVTASPTATAAAAVLPKTAIPSLVAGSVSGLGSCIQNWLPALAVTTPCTSVTCLPTSGETCPAPWIWLIVAGSPGGGGGAPPLPAGSGAPAVKSAALLSVSVDPP